MSISINVKRIENVLHKCDIYIMLDLYLDDIFNELKIREHIHRKFHVVNDMKCRLLMKLDIMTSKKMIINLTDKSLIISTCENMIISIQINSKSNSRIKRIVHSKDSVIIFSNSVTNISIYLREKKLSSNRDFLFELNHDALTTSLEEMNKFYTHVCDCDLTFVHVRNDLFKSMMISLKTRLSILIE